MDNKVVKSTSYTSPKLEIIMFECNDIVTASGYVSDPNEDSEW